MAATPLREPAVIATAHRGLATLRGQVWGTSQQASAGGNCPVSSVAALLPPAVMIPRQRAAMFGGVRRGPPPPATSTIASARSFFTLTYIRLGQSRAARFSNAPSHAGTLTCRGVAVVAASSRCRQVRCCNSPRGFTTIAVFTTTSIVGSTQPRGRLWLAAKAAPRTCSPRGNAA